MRQRVPNTEFHIYGVGPAGPGLADLVAKLGLRDSVHLRGRVSLRDIVPIMENADLGVVPKRKDSFGNEAFSTKILEFMVLGVPVIVSDTKIDTHYFDNSVVKFFRGGSVDDLAASMQELIDNRSARESLVRGGLQFVQSNCWDVKEKLYFELVDSLVGNSLVGRSTRTG